MSGIKPLKKFKVKNTWLHKKHFSNLRQKTAWKTYNSWQAKKLAWLGLYREPWGVCPLKHLFCAFFMVRPAYTCLAYLCWAHTTESGNELSKATHTKCSGYTTEAETNVSFTGMGGEKRSLRPRIFVDKNSKWLISIKII